MILIISGLCASAVYLLFLAVFAVCGRKLPCGIKYRLLLIPLIMAAVPPLDIGIRLPERTEIHLEVPQAAALAQDIEYTAPTVVNTKPQNDAKSVNVGGYIRKIALYGWICGVCALAFVRMAGFISTRRTLARISCEPSPDMREAFAKINTCARARLRCYEGAGTPFVSGVFRPTVYLPKCGIDADDLPLALAHELLHIRRGDLAVKFFAGILCIIHFYNPIMRMLGGSIERMCELSCDEAVTRGLGGKERKRYGMLLLSLMKQNNAPKSCAGMCRSERDIRRRLDTIMHEQKRGAAAVMAAVMLGIGALGVSGCAGALTADNKNEAVQSEMYEQIKTYMENQMYRTFAPYYEILSLEISNYKENEQENSATFFYTLIHKNYDRDPDTVPYIAELRERGASDYEQLKKEYLEPKDMNFEFKAVVDGDEIKLYSNESPHGVEWVLCEIDDFLIPERQSYAGGAKVKSTDPDAVVRGFFERFAAADYNGMKAYCTDKFIDEIFYNIDAEHGEFASIGLMRRATLKDTSISFTEYMKSSNDFNVMADIDAEPSLISSDLRRNRRYEMQLLRSSDGTMLIDGMKLKSIRD